METNQSGSQTGPNEVPQEAADPSPDGPSLVFPTGSIEGRITPEVPLPRDPESDDGWAQIDRVGGWRAIISPFGAMDQVPEQGCLGLGLGRGCQKDPECGLRVGS